VDRHRCVKERSAGPFGEPMNSGVTVAADKSQIRWRLATERRKAAMGRHGLTMSQKRPLASRNAVAGIGYGVGAWQEAPRHPSSVRRLDENWPRLSRSWGQSFGVRCCGETLARGAQASRPSPIKSAIAPDDDVAAVENNFPLNAFQIAGTAAAGRNSIGTWPGSCATRSSHARIAGNGARS
jgi:hypothetical protein